MPPAWSAGVAVAWEPQCPWRALGDAGGRPPQAGITMGGVSAANVRLSDPEPAPAARAPAQVPERTRANTPKRKRKHR